MIKKIKLLFNKQQGEIFFCGGFFFAFAGLIFPFYMKFIELLFEKYFEIITTYNFIIAGIVLMIFGLIIKEKSK